MSTSNKKRPAFDDIYNTWRKTIGLDFNTKVNDKNLSVIVSYNNYKRIKNTYFNELTTLEEVISENEADQDTSVFNSVMSRGSFGGAFSENISTEIGYDIVIEEARGRRIEGNMGTRRIHNLMGEVSRTIHLVMKEKNAITYEAYKN